MNSKTNIVFRIFSIDRHLVEARISSSKRKRKDLRHTWRKAAINLSAHQEGGKTSSMISVKVAQKPNSTHTHTHVGSTLAWKTTHLLLFRSNYNEQKDRKRQISSDEVLPSVLIGVRVSATFLIYPYIYLRMAFYHFALDHRTMIGITVSLSLSLSLDVCMFNFARVLRTSNWSCSVIHVQICNQYRSRPVVSLELFLYQYASFTDQWHPITPFWIVNSNDLLLFCDDRRRVVHVSLNEKKTDSLGQWRWLLRAIRVCVCLRSVNDHRRISLNTHV